MPKQDMCRVCVSIEKLIKLNEYIEQADWNIGSQVDVLEGSWMGYEAFHCSEVLKSEGALCGSEK